jgi:hypothetical protein
VKEKGLRFIEEAGEPISGEVHVGGELEVIGAPEGLRTVSKIAYAGLAFRAGTKLAMNDAFNEIRAYILEGAGKPAARIFTITSSRMPYSKDHINTQLSLQPDTTKGEWMR